MKLVNTHVVLLKNNVYTEPTVTIYPKPCKYGIGEYSSKRMTFPWFLQPHSHRKLTLNTLKFLASERSINLIIYQLRKTNIFWPSHTSQVHWCGRIEHILNNIKNRYTAQYTVVWDVQSFRGPDWSTAITP